jgi:anion-transporting  ArsA/GET3 family ATPase
VSAPVVLPLVDDARVLVCCGAGGVGKTSTATALALLAARRGRRVLALTVDPSKRLAQTLGVEPNRREPTAVSRERLQAAGITAGTLDAWMLDPAKVAEDAVKRVAKDEAAQQRLFQNRLYKEVSRMVAGMQEYTAMEALFGFLEAGRYDLVVLDTPPARNALDFLEGPTRLASLLEGRVFQLFLPPTADTGFFERKASELLLSVLSAAFGTENARDLQEFFSLFLPVFKDFGLHASKARALLSSASTGFLLVTSPADEAVADALYFQQRTVDLKLPFRGFLLNRSEADAAGRQLPTLGADDAQVPALAQAFAKFLPLAAAEQTRHARDASLLATLAAKAAGGSGNDGPTAFARALPTLVTGASELEGLAVLADALASA